MATQIAQAVTEGAAATITLASAATDAGEAAGKAAVESLIDNLHHIAADHWASVLVGLAIFRAMQPLLWHLVQKTKTPVDDKILGALAWVVGAVERHKTSDKQGK